MTPDGPDEPATLVGVATGRPDGGLAVVRLSGPRALELATALAGSLGEPRRLVRRRLGLAGAQGEDALVVQMPAPASYTGEDVVEFHVHAGDRNVATVVETLLEAGARAAGPGDFTRRAFENGRLGLDQAEGIAALIGARTDAALRQARRLAAGEVGRAVDSMSTAIRELRIEVEAHLDFPEDASAADRSRWVGELTQLRGRVAQWLAGFEAGRRARERARFVLGGPPNAGKSSLFNALLGRERALVAREPGTTRDYVEAQLDLGAHGCVLVDTAGLRETSDPTEGAGVGLSRDQLAGADLIIWVEASDADPARDTLEAIGAEVLRVESKRDLGTQRESWVGVSAPSGVGIEQVRRRLEAWFGREGETAAWVGLARHRDCAQQAHRALQDAAEGLRGGATGLEIVAFQLGVAQTRLDEIRGRSSLGAVGEDVLAGIFSRFCIGK